MALTTAPPTLAILAVPAKSPAKLRHELPARASARADWRLRCASGPAVASLDVTAFRPTQSGGGDGVGGACVACASATGLTPCAGGGGRAGGGGGGSDRHDDGENSSLPQHDFSFWLSVGSFVWRNPRRVSAAAVATVGSASSFAYSHSEAGVASQIRKVFEDGGVSGWEKIFRKDVLPACLPRAQLLGDITQLLRPGASPQYSVIVGAAGTGKSTGRHTNRLQCTDTLRTCSQASPQLSGKQSWGLRSLRALSTSCRQRFSLDFRLRSPMHLAIAAL